MPVTAWNTSTQGKPNPTPVYSARIQSLQDRRCVPSARCVFRGKTGHLSLVMDYKELQKAQAENQID